MSERVWLRALADRAGIEASHHTIDGKRFDTTDATRERLLGAMGIEATHEDAARRALEAWDARETARADAEAPRAGAASASVAPRRCYAPPVQRAYGILAQLYSVRSAADWGAGDFASLRALVDWAADVGAAFVGTNPLHALAVGGADPSPYSPSSRLFLHALYLDVAGVPELAQAPRARARLASQEFQADLTRWRAASRMPYAEVLHAKLAVAREMHAAFSGTAIATDTARAADYRRFVEAGGEVLNHYALFQAIADTTGVDDFRRWPAELRDPTSPAVAAFRRERASAVDFHCYLQFELDRQLGGVAARARARGLAVGLYGDLAVGAAPSGADVWARPELFARGVGLGAPPDPFTWEGQNWGLVPIVPWRSAQEDHRFFQALCARNMAHAGALRIDHAMGLRRQYWVPDGMRAHEGAYVRCPEAAWFDVVAAESTRNRCVVVGEDLGTVPEGFREMLAERGILRSQVLYFERDASGEFRAPETYAPLAMVTANTHDLPTLRGLWEGHDIARCRERGVFPDAVATAAAESERQHTRDALVRLLRRSGVLGHDAWPAHAQLCRAVHLVLAAAPCALLGVALDDLGAETEAVNLPGAPDPHGHNWTRRMGRDLGSLAADTALATWLGEVASRRRAPI